MQILLVDDDEHFCRQVKTYLQQQQYDVVTESDGRKAMAHIETLQPSIVILDIELQIDNFNGQDICALIRRENRYKTGKLGVIMISGQYIESADEIVALDLGADAYLVKPFELKRLAASLRALARRIDQSEDGVLRVDDGLHIDLGNRRVMVGNSEAVLTKLEFDVLSFLASGQGKPRTKAALLSTVWRSESIEEGAIAKCISEIRRKISPDNRDQYIKTVFGVGYRLEPSVHSDTDAEINVELNIEIDQGET